MKNNTVTKLPSMAFGLGLGLLLTAVTMSSFKVEKKQVDLYKYNGATPQAWNSSVDQNTADYSLVTSHTCGSSSNICDYNISDSGVVTQNSEGTFQ